MATTLGTFGIAYPLGWLAPLYFLIGGLIMAAPFAAFLLLRSAVGVRRAVWAMPLLWPCVEWGIRHVDGLPPFLDLAVLQANAVWLIQFGDLAGEWGITAWVVLFNILLYQAIVRRGGARPVALRMAAVCALMLAPAIAYSAYRLHGTTGAKPLRVLAVQPFLDVNRAGASKLLEQETYLTDLAVAKAKPDLIIWPEGAIAFPLEYNQKIRRFVAQAVADWGTPLLTGGVDFGGRGIPLLRLIRVSSVANAAFFMSPGAPGSGPGQTSLAPAHIKHRLAPFGETLPYANRFPWLNKLYRRWHPGQIPLTPGFDSMIFEDRTDSGERVAIAPVICWEALYASDLALLARHGAQMFAVVSNDFWFGDSSIPWLHAAIARLRAIETHRPVLRVSTTGPTIALDGRGREVAIAPVHTQATLAFSVAPGEGVTFYVRHPDLFPALCLFTVSMWAAIGSFGKFKRISERNNS